MAMNPKVFIFGILTLIIAIVIGTTVIGETIDDLQNAGDSIGDSTCGGNTTWDATGNTCNDSVGTRFASLEGQTSISSLFDADGVLPLIFLGATFLGLMMVAWRNKN